MDISPQAEVEINWNNISMSICISICGRLKEDNFEYSEGLIKFLVPGIFLWYRYNLKRVF